DESRLKSILDNLIYKQGSHAHPSSHAHACQQDLLFPPTALGQSRYDLSNTSTTKGMPECDCTSARVKFRPIQVQFVSTVYCHRCECFIDLHNIDVAEGDIVVL